jgi:DNA invertase Pin-like site-specific DNA recombinase
LSALLPPWTCPRLPSRAGGLFYKAKAWGGRCMPDFISKQERRLIDEALSAGQVRMIPAGMFTENLEPVIWGRTRAEARRLQAREDAIVAAAGAATVAELAARFGCSDESIYRALRVRGVFALGMLDKR